MQFPGTTPISVPRFGSFVQSDDPVEQPLGMALIGRNLRYTPEAVGTRWGFSQRLTFGAQGSRLAAVGGVRYLSQASSTPLTGAVVPPSESIALLGYTQADGNLYSALPFVQSSVAQLTIPAWVAETNLPLVPGLYPVITQAFNKGMIAMGDLTKGVAPNLIYDPSAATLDEVSDLPFGAPWNPNKNYRVGQVVSPSTFQTDGLPAADGTWVAATTGHLYSCTIAGTSNAAAQPVWPAAPGAVIGDNSVTWTENTPTCLAGLPDPAAPTNPTPTVNLASPILAGATVFLALTYVTALGEGINEIVAANGILDPGRTLEWTNATGGPVNLSVVLPAIPAAVAALGATGYQAYGYIVDGVPDVTQYTDPTYYAQIAGGPFAGGATLTVSTFPVGQAIPLIDTATVSSVGNVDTGVRFMVVLFETRTEYETGFGATSPIRVNVTQAGQMVRVTVPIGPYNTVRRICAFTVAGASSAGPYTYVDQADVESPGFNEADIAITSTCIPDNVTTTAMFNFTDTYLPGASDVTNYFNRIEVPPASAIAFSKTLAQVIYTGCAGYPSGFLVSDLDDPEAIRIPGSNLQCAESDGDRTVGWCEIRENQIALKENSGHAVVPNSGDPSTWAVNRLWSGSGPCGAKAWDVATEDDADFLIYAHQTGPYRVVSSTPQLLGNDVGAIVNTDLQGIWKTINWAVGYKIVTRIDVSRREVRFSLPLNGATENNCTLTLCYAMGWENPVIFIVRSGRLVPDIAGRRWSVDDVVGMDYAYVPRRYQVTPSPGGPDLADNLMLCAPDGALYTLTEGQLFDQDWTAAKVGYLSQWLSVPSPNPDLSIFSLQGATVAGTGTGPLNVYAQDEKGRRVMFSSDARTMILTPIQQVRDFGMVGQLGCRWGIGFDNGGVAGNGFLLNTATLRVKKFFASRLG